MPRILLALFLLLALAAGCGGGDDASGESAATPIPVPQDPAADIRRIVEGLSTDTSSKPEIAAPLGSPPAELEKRDIVRGTGPKAKKGDNLAMQYVGVSWSTGEQFDASWDRGGQPFPFQLGAGMVIPGWDQGMVGMREGGRRLLIVPPDLGYGAGGTPDGAIAPNETLVFVVDLEKLN